MHKHRNTQESRPAAAAASGEGHAALEALEASLRLRHTQKAFGSVSATVLEVRLVRAWSKLFVSSAARQLRLVSSLSVQSQTREDRSRLL